MKPAFAIAIAMLATTATFSVRAQDIPLFEHKSPEERFKESDLNHDNFISKEEFLQVGQQKAAQRFDAMDTNHDGKLSPIELGAAREKMRAYMKSRCEQEDK